MLNGGKWVVFDLDGTLNRTDLVTVEAHRQAQAEYHQPIAQPEEIIRTFGSKSYDYLKLLAPTLTEDERRQYNNRVAELEQEKLKTKGRFYDGSDRMLAALQQAGYHTAICSNSSFRYISGVLSALKLDKLIDEIQPMQKDLPKSGTLKLLLEKTCAQKAVMVGDRVFDMDAAKANSLPFIGCLYGYCPQEVESADRTVHSPLGIIQAVKDLIG